MESRKCTALGENADRRQTSAGYVEQLSCREGWQTLTRISFVVFMRGQYVLSDRQGQPFHGVINRLNVGFEAGLLQSGAGDGADRRQPNLAQPVVMVLLQQFKEICSR